MKAENLFHYYTSVHNNEQKRKPAVYTEFHYLQYITRDKQSILQTTQCWVKIILEMTDSIQQKTVRVREGFPCCHRVLQKYLSLKN